MVPHVRPPNVFELEAESADEPLLSGRVGQDELQQVLGVGDRP